jgi:aminopeptidase N
MKGRGLGTPELDRAAESIAAAMKEAGLEVLPADPAVRNVVGVLRGTKPEWAGSSVVVGAHYDHLGVGAGGTVHPGADDNASGVAVLLELARQMASSGSPQRTVIFAAFTGEETGLQGSKRYVAAPSAWPASKAIGMVNLDTVGRLGAGTILVLGASTADEWIHIANGAGYVTGAPVQAVMNDPGGSDQKSFVEAGVPAVQLFTGAHADYHTGGDTADKVDGGGLVKVAAVAREFVAYLAERDRPLTGKLGAQAPASAAHATGERRASLGTIPDYAFAGPGVRISGTMPGSPAEGAGLKAGDVLVRIGETPVGSMKEFSEALKPLAPGTKIVVTFVRDGATMTAQAALAAR